MKRTILFLTIFTTLILAQEKEPKIFSPEPNYNFKEVLEGQTVEHEYEIINQGNADLIINDVKASCGCTAVQPQKKILKPGEKTKIKIEFDSRGRIGPQKKYVYVFSNDPKTPQYRLSFDVVVVEKLFRSNDGNNPKLVLNSYQYNFGEVDEGKVVEAKIEFKNEGKGVLEINDIKTTCGCTAVMLSSKKLQPGETGTIGINLDTSNRIGQFVRTVAIYSNDPEQPVHVITLSAIIKKRK